MPTFDTRDPSAAAFWSERFDKQFTPWDRGGVPQALREFASRSPRPLTTLIPGCGAGHEVRFLGEAGWDVTAIDFSPSAVATARRAAGPWAQRIIEADFFTFEPPRPPEFIYECAFLCALPPHMRQALATRWAQLLRPGALLGGLFYFGDDPKGPPFGMSAAELETLLMPSFTRIEDAPSQDAIPVFAGKERWQVWERRD